LPNKINAPKRKQKFETPIYTTEKTLSELSDKLPANQKTKIQEGLQGLKNALKSGGLAEIRAKVEELRRVVQDAGATVYQQAAAQRTQQQTRQDTPQPGAAQQEQKTVDAEYETVDG
jgi:molecular chaperone DnaK